MGGQQVSWIVEGSVDNMADYPYQVSAQILTLPRTVETSFNDCLLIACSPGGSGKRRNMLHTLVKPPEPRVFQPVVRETTVHFVTISNGK